MMLQPTKDVLREQLVLAAATIIRQREEMLAWRAVNAALEMQLSAERVRWWHRAWWRK